MNIYHIINNSLKNNTMIKNKSMSKYQTIQYLFLLITMLFGSEIHAGYNPDWIKVENQRDVINGTSLSITTTLKTGNATGNVSVSISTTVQTDLPPQAAALSNIFSWDTSGKAVCENNTAKEYIITATFKNATARSTCRVWAKLEGLTLNHIFGNNNQVGKCVDLRPEEFQVRVDPATEAWMTLAKSSLSIPDNHGPVGEKIATVILDPGQRAECRYTTSLAPTFTNLTSPEPTNPSNPPEKHYDGNRVESYTDPVTGDIGIRITKYWGCSTFSDFQYVFDRQEQVLVNTLMAPNQNYGQSNVVQTTWTAGFELEFPSIPYVGTLTVNGSYARETSTTKQWNENAPSDNRYLYNVFIWQKYYKLSGKAQSHYHDLREENGEIPGGGPVIYVPNVPPSTFWVDETPVTRTSAPDSSGYYTKQLTGTMRVCHP